MGLVAARELLLVMGRISRPSSGYAARLIERMTPADVEAFIRLARFHRVVPQVRTALTDLHESGSPLVDRLLERVSSLVESTAGYAQEHRRHLEELARSTDVRVIAIKGMTVSPLYQPGMGARQVSDADVLVGANDAWKMFHYLAENNYEFWKIRFGKYAVHNSRRDFPSFYGICPTVDRSTNPGIHLDLHFGAFPTCGYGLIVLPDDCLTPHSSGIYEPTAEKSVIISLGHIIRQGFCRLRDVNDFFVLLNLTDLDVARVRQEARHYRLTPLLEAMLRLTSALYGTDEPSVARLNSLTGFLDRTLLFGRRKPDESFTDSVRLGVSRAWQIRYLFESYSDLFGPFTGVHKAAFGSLQLFRSGRAYRVRHKRGGIGGGERFVLVPVAYMSAELPLQVACDRLRRAGYEWDHNPDFEVQVVRSPNSSELVISGRLVCVSADYAGHLADRAAALSSVESVASSLGVSYRALV